MIAWPPANLHRITRFHSILILLLSMLACGMLSIFFGKELGWDLANYHYYQPYAFFHGRATIDYWPPSFIHQFINPTIDFLSYFLINYCSPWATTFLLGAIHGSNVWLLFMIASYFLNPLAALTVALLGMYGPAALSGIGSFQNDDLISLFVLSFVLLYLKGLQPPSLTLKDFRLYPFLWAGLLLGIGIGLKLTAALFYVAASISILFLPYSLKNRFLLFIAISFAVTCGISLSAGYWMQILWVKYHNPLFPFFNHFFPSSYFSGSNWRDYRFLPKDWWQTLFFPFYFSWDGRTADGGFRDFRFAILYTLFIVSFIFAILRKWRFLPYQQTFSLQQKWLFAFFIFSYIIWQAYFSIARYMTPLEMLAPLCIFLLLQQLLLKPLIQTIAATMIFYSLFFFMSPIPLSRARWYENTFFNVKLPSTIFNTKEALVLIAYVVYMNGDPRLDANPRPQSYLIPYFPVNWRFVGVPFGHAKPLMDATLKTTLRHFTSHYPHPIYLLTAASEMGELYRVANTVGLTKAGDCEFIFSDRQKIVQQKVMLCPVKRNEYKKDKVHSSLTDQKIRLHYNSPLA